MTSYQKFLNARDRNNSILCVGLDTDIRRVPNFLSRRSVEGVFTFNKSIIEATKDLVCAFKINLAFYEQYGKDGLEVLYRTIDEVPKDVLLILDAKRGDIGNTASAYAKGFFEDFKADAVTVNPYMGRDSIEPFLLYEDKLVFILSITSNPGSNDFQRLIADGKPVYQHIIEKSSKWAKKSSMGYVVGATHPDELVAIRKIIPDSLLLIPGIGAQGGDIDAVIKANGDGPCMINVSRAVIYASQNEDFAQKAREKAIYYRDTFNQKASL